MPLLKTRLAGHLPVSRSLRRNLEGGVLQMKKHWNRAPTSLFLKCTSTVRHQDLNEWTPEIAFDDLNDFNQYFTHVQNTSNSDARLKFCDDDGYASCSCIRFGN